MAAPRHSRRAETYLRASVATCRALDDHRAAEKVLLRKRRRQWLKAFSEDGSAVTRQRIAEACGVSIQLVDAELKAARAT